MARRCLLDMRTLIWCRRSARALEQRHRDVRLLPCESSRRRKLRFLHAAAQVAARLVASTSVRRRVTQRELRDDVLVRPRRADRGSENGSSIVHLLGRPDGGTVRFAAARSRGHLGNDLLLAAARRDNGCVSESTPHPRHASRDRIRDGARACFIGRVDRRADAGCAAPSPRPAARDRRG